MKKIKNLEEKTKSIRRHIVSMIGKAGSGHPGGSLSAVEIITALYFNKMHHDPKNPNWDERDRFVLSKGHAAPALYATLTEAERRIGCRVILSVADADIKRVKSRREKLAWITDALEHVINQTLGFDHKSSTKRER